MSMSKRWFCLFAPLTLLSSISYGQSNAGKGADLLDFVDLESDDHTEQLQCAIDFSAKKSTKLICKTSEVFNISSTLRLPSNSQIDFGRSVLRRIPGAVFNMLENADLESGNDNILLTRLVVDGNCFADGRLAINPGDRFGGVVFVRVSNSKMQDVNVNATVNAEDGRAAIYLNKCYDVDAFNIGGAFNDRSCIFIENSRVRICGSYTHHNKGSGITSSRADDSEYYDCTAHHNGYSQVSINGLRSHADGIQAWGGREGFSGVNIGHDVASGRSHKSVIKNVKSFENEGWGMTVVGSNDVSLENIFLSANVKSNLYIFGDINSCRISHLISKNCLDGYGVLIRSGSSHKFEEFDVSENSLHGVFVDSNCRDSMLNKIRSFNNGVKHPFGAGILLNGCSGLTLEVDCFDDQIEKTQKFGVWFAGGHANLLSGRVHKNSVSNINVTDGAQYRLTDLIFGGV